MMETTAKSGRLRSWGLEDGDEEIGGVTGKRQKQSKAKGTGMGTEICDELWMRVVEE